MTNILYRYRDVLLSYNRVGLQLSEYIIMRRTPCGAWINDCGNAKFVNLKANKQYACETKDLAYQSFIRRKKRQIAILKSNLYRAMAASELPHDINALKEQYEMIKFDCEYD